MKTRITPHPRLPLLLCLVAMLLGIAPALVGAQDITHSLNAIPLYGPLFTPQQWIPIRVSFTNRGDRAIDGAAVLPLSGDVAADYRYPAVVPAHSRVQIIAFASFSIKGTGGTAGNKASPPSALTTVRWEEHSGARLDRTPILGRPSSEVSKDFAGTNSSGFYLLTLGGSDESADAYDTQRLAATVSGFANTPIVTASIEPQDAARTYGGYAAARIIVLEDADPQALGPAQRQAIMDFINRGGNLVVACPRAANHVADSWLAPYLPVQLLGERRADHLTPTGQAPFAFGEYLRSAEATDNGSGEIVLQDQDYVHAAFQRVGLGRVIFTSFPVSALTLTDPRTAQVWQRMLALEAPVTQWNDTQFETARVDLLQSMLGRSTVSWTAAASVAGAFVLLVLLAQVFIGGAHRPTAFAVSVIAAVLLSIALVGLTIGKTRAQTLSGARLAVMQLSGDGAGEQREVSAYVGQNDADFPLTAARDGVLLRPIIASAGDTPRINEHPFAVPHAGVKALSIERVWQASAPLAPGQRGAATARFGPDGLTLAIDNQLNQPLTAPLLRWGHVKFSLSDLPPGQSQQRPERRNGRDDFTNAAVIRSQTVQLRGDILRALSTPASEVGSLYRPVVPGMSIDAWLEQTTPLLATAQPIPMRGQTLARLPVQLEASPVGSTVKIEPAFTRLVLGESRVSQYDATRDLWLPTNLDATMAIGFAAPWQVGQLRPREVTIDLDVAAPQQTVTIRRGQVVGGKGVVGGGVATGPIVGQWAQPVGRYTATFTAAPGDYDADGHVWLLVSVTSGSSAAGNLVAQWAIRHLETGFTAEVVGPPSYRYDLSAESQHAAGGGEAPKSHAVAKPAPKAKPKSASRPKAKPKSKVKSQKSEDAHAR